MANCGVCCANLKDNKTLMKMGLALVLVGHVNFLLGALVHGAVLRHISVHTEARIMVYAITNVIAIVAGLMGIIGGIIAIVLSKNKKSRILKWVLLVFSFLAGLLAVASTLGLLTSMITAIIHKGRSLMTHCTLLTHVVGSSSVTYECPFDPTRIYVRMQRAVEIPQSPPSEQLSELDTEAVERDVLLDSGGAAAEQSHWL
ncbi:transmembrane protein 54a isoform X2 [Phyllopteryx taeniolatus]|uniref:transmembrane protein 54a isoform X2 n=1 Tax=Phyllopteryx taeniolatus TaxID=161469 RepID=UPI002AD37BC0|nr:transmembrane protein 54a isoform X2 [Phyllopteryx taeniolatus]